MWKYLNKIIIISFFLLFLVNSVKAIEYEYLGGRPANPDPNVPNSVSWFIYNLDKGESKQDSLVVINNLPDETTVIVYAADSVRSSNGGFALKQFVEPREAVGSWIKFYPDTVPATFKTLFAQAKNIMTFCETELGSQYSAEQVKEFEDWCQGKETIEVVIPAKKQREISFTFTVPEVVDVGEHTGGILIQKKETKVTNVGELQGVTLTTRVGIRIYETVPGNIIRELGIKSINVEKGYNEFDFTRLFSKGEKPETHNVITEIENTGNVSIDFTETITITDEFGRQDPIIITDRNFQSLRNDAFTSVYNWENPRFGRFSFESQIAYDGLDGNQVINKSDKVTLWILPIREMIVVLAVALIIFAIFRIKKIREQKLYGGKDWVPYILQPYDSLKVIERKFQVDWEVFVKTNKIKPPYELRPGQKVLVPPKGGVKRKNKLSFRKVRVLL
jgi:hypothetical protein